MSDFVTALFRRKREQAARELEEAEREAAASGKEPFDLARLNELLGAPPDMNIQREAGLRESYYISHPEIRTLTEYAELRRILEMWE
ncbi:MAG: hypothetical protein ABIO92_03840 [Chloroflexia bacterium]